MCEVFPSITNDYLDRSKSADSAKVPFINKITKQIGYNINVFKYDNGDVNQGVPNNLCDMLVSEFLTQMKDEPVAPNNSEVDDVRE